MLFHSQKYLVSPPPIYSLPGVIKQESIIKSDPVFNFDVGLPRSQQIQIINENELLRKQNSLLVTFYPNC